MPAMSHISAEQLQTFAIYAALAAWLIFRYSRPMYIRVGRMWLGPVLFLAMTALAIYGEEQNPATAMAPATIALSLIVGFLAGIPFGILRGMHTTVKATSKPGVMYLGPSWIVAAIWLGAFGARIGLRIYFGHTAFALPLGDGLIAFAIGMLVTSYVAIYKKYVGLEHAAGQA
jgi:hypothetical protein